jgi:hypothetical protein
MAIEHKAFSGGKEIDGFYSGGKEIQEIWGGDTLLWRKKEEVVAEDQWWGEYDLYARFKNPAPYKRAEVGFTTQGRDAPQSYNLAFGFCTRVVNGIYMVTAAAVDNYVLTGQYHNDISMVPACYYSNTADIGGQVLAYPGIDYVDDTASKWDALLKEYRLYTKSESEPIYSWGGAFEEKPFWFKDSDKQAGVFDVSTPQVVSDEETGKYYYYPARLFSNVRDMKNWLLVMRNNPDKWWTDK